MAGKVRVSSEEATPVVLLTGHDMAVKLPSLFMPVDWWHCRLRSEKPLFESPAVTSAVTSETHNSSSWKISNCLNAQQETGASARLPLPTKSCTYHRSGGQERRSWKTGCMVWNADYQALHGCCPREFTGAAQGLHQSRPVNILSWDREPFFRPFPP